MVEAEKIIIRPIISEKSYAQIDHGRYTFEVHPDAHKTMIAQAIQQLFNVTVVGVSTANVRPKPKRRGISKGRTSAWKKAVVQLSPRRQDRILRGQVMGIKRFKPTSPGRRFMTVDTFEDVTRSEPERSLVAPLKKNGGRNSYGRITTRHKGGGHKRRYRIIDFKRDKDGVPAKVAHIEYDPNRSARIALLALRRRREALHPRAAGPQGRRHGGVGAGADIKPGNALPLENIPFGTTIHNLELQPGRGGQLVRSAGTSAQLQAKEKGYGVVRLPSGELRRIRLTCRATVGEIGNSDHSNISGGKAGRTRWRGVRPTVRGTAMNPVDHPHGGGEGKTTAGRHRSPRGASRRWATARAPSTSRPTSSSSAAANAASVDKAGGTF